MGWKGWEGCVAENISLSPILLTGDHFSIDATDQAHSYTVFWTLTVKVVDKTGKPVYGADVRILDKRGREMLNTKTSVDGIIEAQLPEYSFISPEVTFNSPFKVIVGKKTIEVKLDKNMEIKILNK